MLTKKHKLDRMRIISNWIAKNLEWEKVIFSDKKRFSMDGPDNWKTYTHKNVKIVREKRQCGGGSINVWMMSLPNGLLAIKLLKVLSILVNI